MTILSFRSRFFAELFLAGWLGAGCGGGSDDPCLDLADACQTGGATSCNADWTAVLLCQQDAAGCLVWQPLASCGPSQVCEPGFETAACRCQDECPATGGLRCAGTVIETCALDEYGCRRWMTSADCSLSGRVCDETDGAHCAEHCTGDCQTAGETRCHGGSVEACTPTADCLLWTVVAGCTATHQFCAQETGGEAGCACEVGYAGATCAECAVGFQDNDGDGSCLKDCETAGLDCGAHGACGDAGGTAACVCEAGWAGAACEGCAAGYHDDGSGGCVLDESCLGTTCSGHGDCNDAGGVVVCACHEGYTGDHCEGCAAGYQDHDTDGSCAPDCATAGLACGAHGACSDADGTAACVCEAGYAGATCDGCDAAYQDNDGDGVCLPGCSLAALDCGHGACSDSSGLAVCLCDIGYAGASCAGCDSGYQDNDTSGSCEPDCDTAGLDCGDHGLCSDALGSALCVCDTGYTGSVCDGCESGYQDNDASGTCEPDCATAALDCGHGQCSDSSGLAGCVCDAGYAGAACVNCDTGFQDNDGDGTCAADCASAGLDCGVHGACSDALGAALCACDTGYAGAACEGCDTGFQDNDGSGSCEPDCATAGLDCGAHGACSDASGAVTCQCDQGYSGLLCDGCAGGYQDHDGDGLCLPDCNLSGLDCGPHGGCSDAGGTVVCICQAGYQGAACEGCADGYQDNDGDGSCLPTCAAAGLDCGPNGACSDALGTAECVCNHACEVGQSACFGQVTNACVADGYGCRSWQPGTDCAPDGDFCSLVAGAAVCLSADCDDVLQDGDFEAGTPSAVWTEESDVFGTPLCDPAGCGLDAAYSGAWYGWFGGVPDPGMLPESAMLAQEVYLPAGQTVSLFFFLWVVPGAGVVPEDVFAVTLDETPVWWVYADDSADYQAGYTLVELDLSSLADGALHSLQFHGGLYSSDTSFMLDRVSLRFGADCCVDACPTEGQGYCDGTVPVSCEPSPPSDCLEWAAGTDCASTGETCVVDGLGVPHCQAKRP